MSWFGWQASPALLIRAAELAFTAPTPWLPGWNQAVLRQLFRLVPHTSLRTAIAENIVLNPLLSTWIFALVFYLFWSIDDERTPWRRGQLLEIVMACVLAVSLTFVVRPWIGWPAPARAQSFQSLYPDYLAGLGTDNCFPSHSTLVYFTVAAGIWPLRRWLSVTLAVFVLLTVSWPRIYLGGHYPIDVLAAIVLSVVTLVVVRHVGRRPAVSSWLKRVLSMGPIVELALFLWLFELGEGFRASVNILHALLCLTGFGSGES